MTRDEWLRGEIGNLQRKVELYQAMIAEYEQQLGVPSKGASVSSQPTSHGNAADTTGDMFSWISGMIFFNKSQPEAAKIVLERLRYPLTTAQLIAALEKGGVKLGGKTEAGKKQNFYTILNRHPDFGRAKPDTWGLAEWPGIGKKSGGDEDAGAKDAK